MPRLGYKKERMIGGVFILFLILGIGGVVGELFTAFGPSSGWEGDTELVAVKFEDTTYIDKQEILDLGGLTGSRIVSADFDGNAFDSWDGTTFTAVYGFTSFDIAVFGENAEGSASEIRFSVGQLFYTDEEGNVVDEEYRNWKAHEDDLDIGDVYYYFGFSIMFTTRASTEPRINTGGVVQEAQLYRDTDIDYPYLAVEELPEGRMVELEATVDLRISSLTDVPYKGKVNDISLIETVSRYTTDYGLGNDDLDYVNANLDWNSFPSKGVAQSASAMPITLINDVIDTETENVARVKANAKIKPGFDWFDDGVWAYAADQVHKATALQMYDVELMYHVVAEVVINDVPLTDWTAYFSAGTGDYSFRIDEPEAGFPLWLILVVIVVVVIIL
jgi:hypothetical protein